MTAEAAEMDRAAATALHIGRVADAPPATEQPQPLSPLHDTLGQVSRDRGSHWVNRLANHPDIYPLVRGCETGRLDLGPAVAEPANVLLSGQFGALLFHQRQPGLYEVHSMALPEGRGRWMLGFVRACLHWMFTGTDAVEILTRCPKGNRPAAALAKAIGGQFWFTNPSAYAS